MKYLNRKKWLIIILIILCVTVYILEGVILNPFAFWNMVPLIIGCAILDYGLEDGGYASKFGSIGFSVGSVILVLFAHFAWFFDWGKTQTGSSTSGLIFIFLPLYVICGGLMLGLLTALIGMLYGRITKKTV